MARIRENKITFYLSAEQKIEIEARAEHAGLTVPNYLRSLLGWPIEQQGARKDLEFPAEKIRAQRLRRRTEN
jgi:hypothetical protein